MTAGSEHDNPVPSQDDGRFEDAAQTVLVMDTDPGVRWALEKGLQRSGYVVRTASTVGEVLNAAYEQAVDALVMELLPEAGLTQDVVATLAETPGAPRIICVSIETDPQTVIECMRRGADDFIPKPFSLADIRTSLARVLAKAPERRIARSPGTPSADEPESSLLIGVSPSMQELREVIRQVARTDLNCLIRGESGTGKDIVARELHRLSRRNDKPFVKVNCTALPEQLLESELFGYEKGAFTGAVSSKPGRFELANRGMIFLDEIGDMHPNLQAKLLQVIEHKEFTKLGGRRHIEVDVQIIAATNADIEERTRQSLFRDDLYFRLNEVCVWVPALAARKEDIPLLVRHFIRKHGQFSASQAFELSGEDIASLTEHEWPGNVRELESTIKRWLALGERALPKGTPPRPATTRSRQPASFPTPPPTRTQPTEARSEADRISH
ncbi:MAG: sigma-54-dependent Fis family transcriptional regulator, partial [bacterium]|nr:sigma-54-dependent Fis family transcriptional regulator [bacterium]